MRDPIELDDVEKTLAFKDPKAAITRLMRRTSVMDCEARALVKAYVEQAKEAEF